MSEWNYRLEQAEAAARRDAVPLADKTCWWCGKAPPERPESVQHIDSMGWWVARHPEIDDTVVIGCPDNCY